MLNILNRKLSLDKLRKMEGQAVYIFSERKYAIVHVYGMYPVLSFGDSICMNWPMAQVEGIYQRKPEFKLLLCSIFDFFFEKVKT